MKIDVMTLVGTLTGTGVMGVLATQLGSTSLLRRMLRFLDEWEGTPDRPGVIKQLDLHTQRIVTIEARCTVCLPEPKT
jgi:hypothetical protein